MARRGEESGAGNDVGAADESISIGVVTAAPASSQPQEAAQGGSVVLDSTTALQAAVAALVAQLRPHQMENVTIRVLETDADGYGGLVALESVDGQEAASVASALQYAGDELFTPAHVWQWAGSGPSADGGARVVYLRVRPA